MKTKPAETIATAFPTCGEVFHYLVTALNLTAWADTFHDPKTKRRDSTEIKTASDRLRDWATEVEDRVPSRTELQDFIGQQLGDLPHAEKLKFVLAGLWNRVLDEHTALARENATYLDRDCTRVWYAKWQAPHTLYFVWALQKLLRRVAEANGPMLDAPLNELLATAWPETGATTNSPTHPLHRTCYKHYAALDSEAGSSVDSKTIAAWESGEDRPSCDALGRDFPKFPDKLGMLLNFAFAGLLEHLAETLRAAVSPSDWADCRKLLLGQARCLHSLDGTVAEELARTPDMSLADYECLLSECLGGYMHFLANFPYGGLDALDLRVARFRVYEEYQQRFLAQQPPAEFGDFCGRLEDLWRDTALKTPDSDLPAVKTDLAKLRAEHSTFSAILAGPLMAIEARLALRHAPPAQESLQRAFSLYQQAFNESRYRAGNYAVRIAREALGLAALLHRHETGEGPIKPWMKKVLAWWNLLGCGTDFDHEKLEQQIELAESQFTDNLNKDLRDRLKAALPQLGLNHSYIGGTFGFTDQELVKKLKTTPIDRRQKQPIPSSSTIVGRDQSPLMEAIDRGQHDRRHLGRAHEIVRKGGDLNFINSTGDTCLTKAFAAKAYDLVLEILLRSENPIRRETILRVTNKKRISGLEQAISEGQVQILREISRWKNGRGDVIDLSRERIWGQTPLYYAVSCLVHFRMSDSEAYAASTEQMPGQLAAKVRPDIFDAVRKHLAQELNSNGVLACIQCLVNELHVDLDTPNANDHSALTHAVERRLHDVAATLLAAGANVNHRFKDGGTALALAITNDDYEMVRLLIEYKADYRLFVEAIGRPIYAMQMSERMRRLIPAQPS